MSARDQLSGLDLAAVVRELSSAIEGSRLDKIYQLDKNKFLLKLRRPGATHLLLIRLSSAAYLTSHKPSVPERPTPFCMGLRKDLWGGRLVRVAQHGLDRVLELVVAGREGERKLIFELFGDGNVILMEPDGRIKRVLRPREMRDRKLLVGEGYKPPPRPPIDPRRPEPSELARLRELGSLELVRGLSRLTGLGGPYPEEVLLRAGIPKDRPCSSLTDEELERLSSALSSLVEAVLTGPLRPAVVVGPDGSWLDVVPIEMLRYSGHKLVGFPDFNSALDAYFTRLERLKARESGLRALEEEVKRLERRLRAQEEALGRLREEADRLAAAGNAIFTRLDQLNFLLDELRKLRDVLGSWRAVADHLDELRERGEPFSWIRHLSPDGPSVLLNLDGIEVELDLRRRAQDIAADYYERAKKARRKARGAEEALEETRKRLEALRASEAEVAALPEAVPEIPARPEPREAPKRKTWYERFRWFLSSDGFLVVAGKDASTNELLVKRYAEPGDLLLHTELPGAPFVLIKAGGREVPEETLLEAAQMAVSYSRAWKYGLGAATAMCFKPEQAKKVGPHGEKLPKGAFYIAGKKEYIRGVELLLAIGLIEKPDGSPEVIAGPVGAVKARTDLYVLLKPGDRDASELAGQIARVFEARRPGLKLPRELLERIRALIPYGRGELAGGR